MSTYFIPAWMSSSDYSRKKDKAEEQELQRLWNKTEELNIAHGRTVRFTVLDADENILGWTQTDRADTPEKVMTLLQKVIDENHFKPRDPSAVRATAAPPRPWPQAKTPAGIVVHVWTRPLRHWTNGGYGEDWVELESGDLAALKPPVDSHPGSTWDVSPKLTNKLFPYFYPAVGAVYEVTSSKIHSANLTATVLEDSPEKTTIALRGSLDMNHPEDKNHPDWALGDGRILAKLIGVAEYDVRRNKIVSLQMVSEKAAYKWSGIVSPWFAIVVESPPER